MLPENTFTQRQQQFTTAKQAAQRQYNQFAFGRLIWFAASILVVTLFIRFDQQTNAALALVVGVVGFLVLLKKHQAVKEKRDRNQQLIYINQDEALRLKRQYLRPETGEQFASPTHAYTGDLDIFGKHSVFRLLNRTHTYEGQKRLVKWLLNPSAPDAIRLRHQVVNELKPQIDWRQQFEASAYLEETVGQSPAELIKWATADAVALPAYLQVARFALPAGTVGLVIAWMMGMLPSTLILIALAIHGFVLSQTSARAKEVSEQTFEISRALRVFQSLFEQAEGQKGEAIRLKAIRQLLTAQKQTASEAIGSLAKLTEGLNYRRNPYFYLLFGIATLWDIQYLFRLESWRNTHGAELSHWFEALGELEALNSLAGFAYAHPGYITPDIVDDDCVLDFTLAAHPLLPPDRSVANSLTFNGPGKTVLITGSNMSGKSTFLRTVGANVVLALAGAVVSAERFWCSPVQVFTSMRTQDSLEESTSSFYAELKRLQTLIHLTRQANRIPVLFFLDEILKGTNSADRHRGAEALIRQLHHTTASGFVSTHDLELGQLTDADTFVRNYHFQSDLQNGELIFDYKLRDGICQSFNASQLMKAIGIEMD